MQSMLMDRDNGIDYLKLIGLTGIILAHVNAPAWIMMARSFDVPLMILLSSILARRSYKRFGKENNLCRYYFHRIKRLVVPVWLFLFIYFGVCFAIGDPYRGTLYYLYSFGFTRYGIGYVWIILIYLYVMLLIPMIDIHYPSAKTIIVIAVLYGLYEISYFLGFSINNKLVDSTFYYIIPYGVLSYFGYYYTDFTKRTKYLIIVLSSLAFVIFDLYYYSIYGEFQLVSIAKYPPRLYYLSFGLACSFILLLLSETLNNKHFNNSFVCFVGSHTMWIYLWHILALRLYTVFHLPEKWYIKFFIVYFGSIFFTMIINTILDIVEEKYNPSIFKYFRG